jgi:hypothetical protein
MSNKEKLYHIVTVVAIPISILSAILLVRMGRMADAGQISMSNPVMSFSSLLLMAIIGMGVIWIVVSGLINANIKAIVRKGEKGKFKTYAGIVAFFIILIVLSLFTPLWMIGLAALAIYLLVISSKALITNLSSEKI